MNKKVQAKIFFSALCPKRIVKLSHQDVINNFKMEFSDVLNIFEHERLADGTHDDRGLAFVITYIITSFLSNPECSSFITSQVVEYIFEMLEQKKKYVFLRYDGFQVVHESGKKNIFTSNFKDSWFVNLHHGGALIFDKVTILEVMNHQSLLMSLWRIPVYNSKYQMYDAHKRVMSFDYFIRHLINGKQQLEDLTDQLYQSIIRKQLMLDSDEKSVLLELSSSTNTNFTVAMVSAVLDLAQQANLNTEMLSNRCEQKHTAMTRAILKGNTGLIEQLLTYGVDLDGDSQTIKNLSPITTAAVHACQSDCEASLYAVGESCAYVYFKQPRHRECVLHSVKEQLFKHYEGAAHSLKMNLIKQYLFRGFLRGVFRYQSAWRKDQCANFFNSNFSVNIDAYYAGVFKSVHIDQLLEKIRSSINRDDSVLMEKSLDSLLESTGVSSFIEINLSSAYLSDYSLGYDYMNVVSNAQHSNGAYFEPVLGYVAWVKSVECMRTLIKRMHERTALSPQEIRHYLFKKKFTHFNLSHWIRDYVVLSSDLPDYIQNKPLDKMITDSQECLSILSGYRASAFNKRKISVKNSVSTNDTRRVPDKSSTPALADTLTSGVVKVSKKQRLNGPVTNKPEHVKKNVAGLSKPPAIKHTMTNKPVLSIDTSVGATSSGPSYSSPMLTGSSNIWASYYHETTFAPSSLQDTSTRHSVSTRKHRLLNRAFPSVPNQGVSGHESEFSHVSAPKTTRTVRTISSKDIRTIRSRIGLLVQAAAKERRRSDDSSGEHSRSKDAEHSGVSNQSSLSL